VIFNAPDIKAKYYKAMKTKCAKVKRQLTGKIGLALFAAKQYGFDSFHE
jgi:hypothetical protein